MSGEESASGASVEARQHVSQEPLDGRSGVYVGTRTVALAAYVSLVVGRVAWQPFASEVPR